MHYKILGLALCWCLMTVPALADLEITMPVAPPVPQWSEFAPVKYINPSSRPVMAPLSKKKKALIILGGLFNPLLPVVVFGIRKMKEKNELELKEYWTRRKIQFDNEVATCDATTDKAMCFMQVRQMESQKSQAIATPLTN